MKAKTKKETERDREVRLRLRMEKLIDLAIEKMNPNDLLNLMYDKCLNMSQRHELEKEMGSLLALQGGIVVKLESLSQKEKLMEFVEGEIWPCYNRQSDNIFSY